MARLTKKTLKTSSSISEKSKALEYVFTNVENMEMKINDLITMLLSLERDLESLPMLTGKKHYIVPSIWKSSGSSAFRLLEGSLLKVRRMSQDMLQRKYRAQKLAGIIMDDFRSLQQCQGGRGSVKNGLTNTKKIS